MKFVKSLLLASAAGLVAVAGAQAADLPMRKAAPVEYVRVCSASGTGFFYIPGTETCLRISGRVRADYIYNEPALRSDDALTWVAQARLELDARTQTAYGLLRTFIRFQKNVAGGREVSDFLNKAFIQFGGLTAGRVTSFFDFYANDLNFGGLPTGSDTDTVDPVVLAYTASFGSGFSATLSIEDPAARRVRGGYVGTFGNEISYAGQRMPEIVGSLRVDQDWGSAQLSGAVHQVNVLDRDVFGRYADTEYGFAVQAGAKFNLPFLAPGDLLWLQAAYAQGAVNYLGLGTGFAQRDVLTANADAVVDAFGDVKKTEGWVLTAAFLHYWTPQIRQGLFGSYGKVDYSATVEEPLLVGGYRFAGSLVDTNWWQVGTNVIWSPVEGLDIGGEVIYKVVDPKGRLISATDGFPYTVGKDDAIEGRLRIQRDF